MNNPVVKVPPVKEVAYTVENRQFIVRRQFSGDKTVVDLLATEISHGILQSAHLPDADNPDMIGV